MQAMLNRGGFTNDDAMDLDVDTISMDEAVSMLDAVPSERALVGLLRKAVGMLRDAAFQAPSGDAMAVCSPGTATDGGGSVGGGGQLVPAAPVRAEGVLGGDPTVWERAAVHTLGVQGLNPMQQAALQHIDDGHHLLVHSSTGSGKSLVYLTGAAMNLTQQKTVVVVEPVRSGARARSLRAFLPLTDAPPCAAPIPLVHTARHHHG